MSQYGESGCVGSEALTRRDLRKLVMRRTMRRTKKRILAKESFFCACDDTGKVRVVQTVFAVGTEVLLSPNRIVLPYYHADKLPNFGVSSCGPPKLWGCVIIRLWDHRIVMQIGCRSGL